MTREAVHGYWGKPDYEAFGFFGDIYHVPDTFESIVFRYDESEIVTAVEIEYRNEVPGDALFIVEIRDREKEEHLNCAEAEELFFEDDEYEYYFNVILVNLIHLARKRRKKYGMMSSRFSRDSLVTTPC